MTYKEAITKALEAKIRFKAAKVYSQEWYAALSDKEHFTRRAAELRKTN